jgi:hypothetical protein
MQTNKKKQFNKLSKSFPKKNYLFQKYDATKKFFIFMQKVHKAFEDLLNEKKEIHLKRG